MVLGNKRYYWTPYSDGTYVRLLLLSQSDTATGIQANVGAAL